MENDNSYKNLVVERYLRDELSSEEAIAFEEDFLGSGELLDQLESAESLEQGLRDIATLHKSTSEKKQSGWIPSLFQSPRYAMAASFFLVVSLAMTSVMFQRLNDLSGSMGNLSAAAAQIVPLVSVRSGPGSEPVNRIELGEEATSFVFMLDPGFENYSHFRATVSALEADASQAVIMQVDGLTPGYEDMLALNVPAALLNPGDFEIQIEGWRDEWSRDHSFDPVSILTLRVNTSD